MFRRTAIARAGPAAAPFATAPFTAEWIPRTGSVASAGSIPAALGAAASVVVAPVLAFVRSLTTTTTTTTTAGLLPAIAIIVGH